MLIYWSIQNINRYNIEKSDKYYYKRVLIRTRFQNRHRIKEWNNERNTKVLLAMKRLKLDSIGFKCLKLIIIFFICSGNETLEPKNAQKYDTWSQSMGARMKRSLKQNEVRHIFCTRIFMEKSIILTKFNFNSVVLKTKYWFSKNLINFRRRIHF